MPSLKIMNYPDIEVTYSVMEMADIKPSHLPNNGFIKNPDYPYENERRYHTEKADQDKICQIASQLDPDFLLAGVDANQGCPVLDSAGHVLGGNGRLMGIMLSSEKFPKAYRSYKAALALEASSLGLDANTIASMKNPVLVRVIPATMTLAEGQALISKLNDSFTHTKSSRIDGLSRGKRLSKSALLAFAAAMQDDTTLRQCLDKVSSDFIEVLIADGVILPTEKQRFIDSSGYLNPDGKDFIECALRGNLFPDYDSIMAIPTPIMDKIDAIIPFILIADGVSKDWSITAIVQDAIRLLAEYRTGSEKVHTVFLDSLSMLDGTTPRQRYSKEAVCIFNHIIEKTKKDIVTLFRRYAGQASISSDAGGMGVGKSCASAKSIIFGNEITEASKENKKEIAMNINENTIAEDTITIKSESWKKVIEKPVQEKKSRKARTPKPSIDHMIKSFGSLEDAEAYAGIFLDDINHHIRILQSDYSKMAWSIYVDDGIVAYHIRKLGYRYRFEEIIIDEVLTTDAPLERPEEVVIEKSVLQPQADVQEKQPIEHPTILGTIVYYADWREAVDHIGKEYNANLAQSEYSSDCWELRKDGVYIPAYHLHKVGSRYRLEMICWDSDVDEVDTLSGEDTASLGKALKEALDDARHQDYLAYDYVYCEEPLYTEELRKHDDYLQSVINHGGPSASPKVLENRYAHAAEAQQDYKPVRRKLDPCFTDIAMRFVK